MHEGEGAGKANRIDGQTGSRGRYQHDENLASCITDKIRFGSIIYSTLRWGEADLQRKRPIPYCVL